MTSTDLYAELQWRGLIQDQSPDLADRLAAGPARVYCGYDPTAPSLHAGNLQQIVMFRHFQRHGHHVIALAGGGTGLIGDPSGKSAERPLNEAATVEAWAENVRGQIARIVDPEGVTFVNNLEWLGALTMVEFLRDVGKHFPMGYMLAKESVKTRVHGDGMSYAEFSYMLLQSYDFLRLYDDHGCRMQFGGSDQWGNITAGLELLRRTGREGSVGMTVPLLLKADGTKFGKTAGGAVWLDREMTSPYAFFQFWLNSGDEQVCTLLRRLSLLEREEIEALEARHAEAPHERIAQRALAEHMTAMVHGDDGLREAVEETERRFGGGDVAEGDAAAIPVDETPSWPDVFVAAGITASKSEARKLIAGGGLYVDDRKLTPDDPAPVSGGDVLVLRKGKKTRVPVRLV